METRRPYHTGSPSRIDTRKTAARLYRISVSVHPKTAAMAGMPGGGRNLTDCIRYAGTMSYV